MSEVVSPTDTAYHGSRYGPVEIQRVLISILILKYQSFVSIIFFCRNDDYMCNFQIVTGPWFFHHSFLLYPEK